MQHAFVEISRMYGLIAKMTADDVRDHAAAWGVHRQGHFFDRFGHMWLVGDRSPLNRFA